MSWASFLPLIMSLAGTAAAGAGKISKGRAEGRAAEADLGLQQDRNALDQYGIQERGAVDRYGIQQRSILDALGMGERGTMDRAGLDLAQKSFALNAPQTRAQTALMGDKFAHGTNMTISHPRATIPTMSGGFTMNDLSPEMREMGQLMLSQSLASQKAGDQFTPPPMADFGAGVMAPPAMGQGPTPTPFPQSGKLDTFLNVLAGIGGMTGGMSPAIAALLRQQGGGSVPGGTYQDMGYD